jgi:membrane associated rhomboid family serine protease
MKLSGGEGAGGGLMNMGGIATQVNYRLGASLPLAYDITQPWRFVTAIFLHGGLLHIGFNMWVLMDIGPMVEELYGSARYLFLYVATGVAGYILSSSVGHLSVGASGSLLGLIGVLLAATTGRKSMAAQALRSALIRWLIYIGVLGFIFSGTDNYAHFLSSVCQVSDQKSDRLKPVLLGLLLADAAGDCEAIVKAGEDGEAGD